MKTQDSLKSVHDVLTALLVIFAAILVVTMIQKNLIERSEKIENIKIGEYTVTYTGDKPLIENILDPERTAKLPNILSVSKREELGSDHSIYMIVEWKNEGNTVKKFAHIYGEGGSRPN